MPTWVLGISQQMPLQCENLNTEPIQNTGSLQAMDLFSHCGFVQDGASAVDAKASASAKCDTSGHGLEPKPPNHEALV